MLKPELWKMLKPEFRYRGISIAHYRLPIWAISPKKYHQTSWGEVQVEGKARVIHRDILDAIWLVADSIILINGRYVIDFAPGKVLKALRTTKKGRWLHDRLKDIYDLDLNYKWAAEDWRCEGNFRYIESFIRLEEKTGRKGQFHGNKYRIQLTELGTRLEREEVTIDIRGHLQDILDIKSNFCRSVVRFFLTHSKGFAIKFSTLLVAVGADHANNSRFKAEFLKEEAAVERFGVKYNKKKDIVFYKKIRLYDFNINQIEPF